MRLPIVPQLSTKDGTSNKNARLTNCLKESKKTGDKAVVRPGLLLSDTYTGLGSGLIPFDGRLLVIYDDTVYDTEEDLSLPWPLDSLPWSAGTTYALGDSVWYDGSLWFSAGGGNVGNTPGGGSYWTTSKSTDTYDNAATYAIGDSVVYGGVTYYSYAPSNTGNDPSATPVWSTTPPGTSRYRGQMPAYASFGAGNPGPTCASQGSAAYLAFASMTTFISCATKGGSQNWITYVGVQDRGGFGVFIRVNQWADIPPFDCSGGPTDAGIVDGGTITQTA